MKTYDNTFKGTIRSHCSVKITPSDLGVLGVTVGTGLLAYKGASHLNIPKLIGIPLGALVGLACGAVTSEIIDTVTTSKRVTEYDDLTMNDALRISENVTRLNAQEWCDENGIDFYKTRVECDTDKIVDDSWKHAVGIWKTFNTPLVP